MFRLVPSKRKDAQMEGHTDIVKSICLPYIAFLMKEVSLMNKSVKKLLKSVSQIVTW